ncbi:MAG: cytosine deaminase [Caldiserica bacterium]|nr:MAG: cytosine deaminase [Caldisericota bacterium]
MYDIVIRNAKTRKLKGLVDIGILDGKIKTIREKIDEKGSTEIDAKGKLVTESFVNAHLHLCKVYTLMMMTEEALKDYHGEDMGKAMTAIELAAKIKEKYDEKWILPNVRKALRMAALNGVTHIRAFADVDNKAKLEGIKALIKARDEFKGIVDVEVVAFPQDGVVREPGAYELVREAMKLGADVVGGIPWIEFTEEDEQEHIDKMFEIAKEFDKPVSMLVDDAGDPGLRTLEMLALKAIKEGWEGRVLAHHARAMALYPKPYFMKLVAILKKAKMGVISDPHTGPLHARVKEMIEEGALVALGQDDISDAYYPYGRNNMLEVAFLSSHILWMTTSEDMEKLYDMITVDAAEAMGIKNFGLKEGNDAHLVVLKEENVLEALRNHDEPEYIISHGKLVDKEKFRG